MVDAALPLKLNLYYVCGTNMRGTKGSGDVADSVFGRCSAACKVNVYAQTLKICAGQRGVENAAGTAILVNETLSAKRDSEGGPSNVCVTREHNWGWRCNQKEPFSAAG